MACCAKPARRPRRPSDPPNDMLLLMFKRQTTGSVVCASCGSLVGVNDDTCYQCGRRNPGLWGFGPMLRAFGNDLGLRPARRLWLLGALRHQSCADGCLRRRHHGQWQSADDAVAGPGHPDPARGIRRRARVPVWPVVDRSERIVAAWRRPAHPFQHALGAAARTRDRGHLWSGPHDHHLHRGGRGGIHLEQSRGATSWAGCPFRSCGAPA